MAAYHSALEELTPTGVPLDWAQTQNNLATALIQLSEWTGNPAHLLFAWTAIDNTLSIAQQFGNQPYIEWSNQLAQYARTLAIGRGWELPDMTASGGLAGTPR